MRNFDSTRNGEFHAENDRTATQARSAPLFLVFPLKLTSSIFIATKCTSRHFVHCFVFPYRHFASRNDDDFSHVSSKSTLFHSLEYFPLFLVCHYFSVFERSFLCRTRVLFLPPVLCRTHYNSHTVVSGLTVDVGSARCTIKVHRSSIDSALVSIFPSDLAEGD